MSPDYSPDVPVFCMRAMPALFGALLVPTVYQLMVELKLSRWTAAFTSCLVVFGMYKLLRGDPTEIDLFYKSCKYVRYADKRVVNMVFDWRNS